MGIELTIEELNLLVDLVEIRVAELRPEIRRSREHQYRSALKREHLRLTDLLDHLRSARHQNFYVEEGKAPHSIQP